MPLPTLAQLTAKHPDYTSDVQRWDLLRRLVAGGKEVNDETKTQLLCNPVNSPSKVVAERIKSAPYLSLIGPILLKLGAQLCAEDAHYSADGGSDLEWQQFFTNGAYTRNGRGSFLAFLSEAMLEALTTQSCLAQIDVGISINPVNKFEQIRTGATEPYVILRSRSDLWDWAHDSEDSFKFVKLHTFRKQRERWNAPALSEHEFLIYERSNDDILASRYLVRSRDPEDDISNLDTQSEQNVEIIEDLAPTVIFHVRKGAESVFKFPLVQMTLPSPLWIADQLLDCQKSHYNTTAAVEWALLSTNYAHLIFTEVEDEELLAERLSQFGDGYYTALPPNVNAVWLERTGGGIDRGLKYRDVVKGEMLEQIAQIAATAANAYAHLARSGDSQREYRKNLGIMLEVYGTFLSKFAKQILDVASIARGELLSWTVSGFNDYDGDDLATEITEYLSVSQVVKSPTFHREAQTAIAAKAVKSLGLDREKMADISEEIRADSKTNEIVPETASLNKPETREQ